MDPADWDFGTADLSLEEEAAYLRIVNAIHKHTGPVPDNDRVIAGLFRTSTRKARSLVNALIKAGKLTIEDGKIWNERARSDLVHRGFVSVSRAESGAKGGRTRSENADKALKNNNASQAIASAREEKSRVEYKEKEASASLPRNVSALPSKALLPEGWIMPPDFIDYATAQGLTDQDITDEGFSFHAYFTDKREKRSERGWLASWQRWARKSAGDRKCRPAHRQQNGPDPTLANILRLASLR